MESAGTANLSWLILLLTAVFVAIGMAIAAGGKALSALLADRTTEDERPKVLSVVWGMRLLGVLFVSVLVNQVYGDACSAGASTLSLVVGLDRLAVVTPPLLLGLGVVSVFGVEHQNTFQIGNSADEATPKSQHVALP